MLKLLFISIFIPFLISGQVKERYNYIQKPDLNSVTIAWRTSVPGVSFVKWGTDSLNLKDSIVSLNSIRKHVFEITGLNPDSKYYYQTKTENVFLSEIEYFHTAKQNSRNHFSFLHYGDCGYNNTIQNDIARLMEAEVTDFGIVAGDVDQNKGINYDEIFFGVYKDLLKNSCHFTCIGNHDTYADDAATYLDEFYLPSNNPQNSERYYSYAWGNAKFICLDSNIPYTEGSDQYNWLVDELKCNDKQWLFTFFHHPPWTNAWSPDYNIPFLEYFRYKGNVDMRSSLVPLFEKHKVDFVLNGHSHCYQRGELNGVKYVISGGAGSSRLDKKRHSKSPNIDTEIYKNQYVRFDVKGDTVIYTAIDIDGNIIDVVETVKIAPTKTPYITQLGYELKCNLNGKYQWFLDGIAIENGNDINYNIHEGGIYEVQVINEIGCTLNSEPLKIIFRKGTLKSN
jgi:hypothetical protein